MGRDKSFKVEGGYVIDTDQKPKRGWIVRVRRGERILFERDGYKSRTRAKESGRNFIESHGKDTNTGRAA